MIDKIKKLFFSHKIAFLLVVVLLIIFFYYGYSKIYPTKTETRYNISTVERGSIISTISGSGQVSAEEQMDIKPKASGDISWLNVKVGQVVSAGQILASLDTTDKKKAISDAEIELQEMKLSFDKSVAQAPIDYDRKLESLEKAKDSLIKTYEDAFNNISNAFLDLPSVITGIDSILYGYDVNTISKEWNLSAYKNMFIGEDRELITSLCDIAERDYRLARIAYDKSFLDFKNITRYSERSLIENTLEETLETTKLMAQAAKSENNLLDTILDISETRQIKISPTITSLKNNLRSYLSTTNSRLSSLLDQRSSLINSKQSIIDIERDLQIMKVNNPTGINPITLQISQNSIRKKEVALADLKADLANYNIRSPISGIIAKVNSRKGDTVSNGTAIASVISQKKIAEITLNEVDVAGIKLGQKATLTFDAIDDFIVVGEVIEVGALGSVSQGVVTYSIKIGFDTEDERVRPGMSVGVSIITGVKQDILVVPNSALKTRGDLNYVEIIPSELGLKINNGQITTDIIFSVLEKYVELGDFNDTHTEILSGLVEGEEIITMTRTINQNSSSGNSNNTTTNLFRVPGTGTTQRQFR